MFVNDVSPLARILSRIGSQTFVEHGVHLGPLEARGVERGRVSVVVDVLVAVVVEVVE